jgi:putative ABC transport system permease protein
MLHLLKVVRARVRGWFSLGQVDEEFKQELDDHLEMLRTEGIRRGLTREEALREARLRLGGMTQLRETNRELHGLPLLDTLFQDVRYGLRTLGKSPGFTAVAVLTLALGIGANTAIFSVIHAVLLSPLPYDKPDRIVLVWESNPAAGFNQFAVAPPNYVDWRRDSSSFEFMASVARGTFNYTGGAEPERLDGARVAAPFFAVFGVQPALGRTFLPEDDVPGKAHAVVLGHGFWMRRFGGDRNILGKALTLDGQPYSVIGVMPEGFQFPTRVELWLPSEFTPQDLGPGARGAHYLRVLARLKPGVSLGQAQAEMTGIANRLQEQYPKMNKGWSALVISLNEATVGKIRATLLVLFGAVGFLLLIACANVANLLLARAATRHREMAIRTSLGAGRWRIAKQLLTESVMLSTMGSALGLFLAEWGVRALRTLPPSNLPRAAGIQLDFTVMGFAVLLGFATGVLFGLVPALQNLRNAPAETLKEGGRTASAGRHGIRSFLVVLETTLALMLLVGSGLLLKSFLRLQQVDPGYQSKSLLTASVSLPDSKYATDPQKAQFFTQLLARLQTLKGVQAVGAASSNALEGQAYSFAFATKELAAVAPTEQPSAGFYNVSPDYFHALGIPLLTGRTFTLQDNAGGPRVAIISQSVAKQFFRGRNPVGQLIFIGNSGPDKGQIWREVVGVVGDIKDEGLESGGSLALYEPYSQMTWSEMTVFLRTDGDPSEMAGVLRNEVRGLDKDQPVAAIATGDELMARSVAQPQLRTFLLALFAGVALLLAGFGVYGVMSNTVAQRTHEIGVRVALGAQRRAMLRLVVGNGMRLALLGVAFGTAGALMLTRLMKGFLFQVTPTDPWTFAEVAFFLVVVALLASYIPARRAMRVDPVVALRYE